MPKKQPKTDKTPKEIADQFGISVSTLERRIQPFKPLFMVNGKRKRFYSQSEVDFIATIVGTKYKIKSKPQE